MRRSDVFAQCVSFTRASQTGVWHTTEELGAKSHGQVRLDLREFERYLKAFLTFRRYEEEMFSETEMLRFNYESDIRDAKCNQASAKNAFEFLGLPAATVASKYVKMAADPLDQEIANYEEVADLAHGLGVSPSIV